MNNFLDNTFVPFLVFLVLWYFIYFLISNSNKAPKNIYIFTTFTLFVLFILLNFQPSNTHFPWLLIFGIELVVFLLISASIFCFFAKYYKKLTTDNRKIVTAFVAILCSITITGYASVRYTDITGLVINPDFEVNDSENLNKLLTKKNPTYSCYSWNWFSLYRLFIKTDKRYI